MHMNEAHGSHVYWFIANTVTYINILANNNHLHTPSACIPSTNSPQFSHCTEQTIMTSTKH